MTKRVAILMGSANDAEEMAPAREMLERFDVPHEVWAMSAHRNADAVREFVSSARANDFGAVIAGAGMAAHLAGACAAHTTLPVIGVPLASSALNGVDSLYSIVQMPTGLPVATVAINGTANAALLAVEILSVSDDDLAKKLDEYRNKWEAKRL
jgi:5-(carboxyamino)imidazole ribonucleotide mutase